MKTGYKVCDAMTRVPFVLRPTDNVLRCAQDMSHYGIGAIVVKEEDKVVGIITESDLIKRFLAKNLDSEKTTVKDIMTREMNTISPELDIFDALLKMKELDVRRLPVCDEDRMVGLLTLKDIMRIQPQLFDLIVERWDIREQSRKLIHTKPTGDEGICETCGEFSEKVKDVKGSVVCEKCSKES